MGPGVTASTRRTILVAAALAYPLAGCGGEEAPGPSDETSDTAAGRPDTPAVVADTQYVVDSAGRTLQLVIERRRRQDREIRPRAGSGDPDEPGVIETLDPATAHERLRSSGSLWYVLDVRDSRAWAGKGHLPGALLVPLGILEENIQDLHVRKGQAILVYGHGVDGMRAARTLAYYGYPRVRVLTGGFDAWLEAGLPVEGGR